jgi:hypothetical protein
LHKWRWPTSEPRLAFPGIKSCNANQSRGRTDGRATALASRRATASNCSLCVCGLAECDEATAVPVDYEAVPWNVEYKDMMTAPVEREAVPQPVPRSEVRLRSRASRGLVGGSDAGLTLLGGNASRRCGAFRSSTRRLSAVVRSQRRPAIQLERSAHGAIVVALRQNRPLGKRECKDRGGCDR